MVIDRYHKLSTLWDMFTGKCGAKGEKDEMTRLQRYRHRSNYSLSPKPSDTCDAGLGKTLQSIVV